MCHQMCHKIHGDTMYSVKKKDCLSEKMSCTAGKTIEKINFNLNSEQEGYRNIIK